MPYDFETLIDRRGTGSMKGRIMEQLGLSEDVLPLQGAEFDFPTCPHVARAMEKRGASGAYCFAGSDAPEYLAAVRNWMARVRGCAFCSMKETCALRKGGTHCGI